LPTEPERESLKNLAIPRKQISNGELSCAAAALLVKPVRVGVSLGDLLDPFFDEQQECPDY